MAQNLLSVKTVEAARPQDDEYLMADGNGLFLRIRPHGTKTWTFVYTLDGKRKKLTLGDASLTTLATARTAAAAARQAVSAGVDPAAQQAAERIATKQRVEALLASESTKKIEQSTGREMFDAWLTDGVSRKDGNAELRRAFEKDVLPSIGDTAVREITEHEIRAVLRSMVKRGAHRMAARVHADLVQMFTWAAKRKPWRGLMPDGNPTDLVEIAKLMPRGVELRHERDRVLSPDEIRSLRKRFETMAAAYGALPPGQRYTGVRPLQQESQIALWISLGTACRIGELLMARWSDVDLGARTWRVPVANVKGTAARQQDHVVSLSDFVVGQFEALHALTAHTPWCFPARGGEDHVCVKSVSKQVGDRQVKFKNRKPLANRRHDDTLVLGEREWTPHDLRRTAATMLQELGVSLDVIDRIQGHVLAGSRVRRHYLHHSYASEMRTAWIALGARLGEVLDSRGN